MGVGSDPGAGFDRLRRPYRNATAINTITRMPTPTPIPAFAPVDSPLELELTSLPPGASPVDVLPGTEEEVPLGVLVGAVVDPEGEPSPDAEDDDSVADALDPLALPVTFAQMATKSSPTATLTRSKIISTAR